MAITITKDTIQRLILSVNVVEEIEKGFVAYSNGHSVVPPVGELLFDNPPGEAHIKYGYIKHHDYYLIKIASGFYNNPDIGLSSSQGIMLLFSQKTGVPEAILLDEGYLTDIRTAAAGALAAKYFAPKNVTGIGIMGTGIQARLQLAFLRTQTTCRTAWIWGRNTQKATTFAAEFSSDFDVRIASTPSELASHTNLIVTTTPSTTPLLCAADILPGTHITAVGSDTPEKQELHGDLLQKADRVIADSLPQSKSRGEVFQAVQNGYLKPEQVSELGAAIQNSNLQRKTEAEITVADLTGVAVQDIMIATSIYKQYLNENV